MLTLNINPLLLILNEKNNEFANARGFGEEKESRIGEY